MYHKTPVSVPDIPGKLVFHLNKGSVYVLFEVGRTYNPEKKYNIPKRKIIGKLVVNEDRSSMFPNETYFELFSQKGTWTEAEDAKTSLREDDGRSCCLKIGAQMVIQRTAEEVGVAKILKKRLGDGAGLSLDIISYLLVNEDNAGQYYPDFAYNHPLSTEGMKIYSDSKVSRFFNDMTRDQIIGILDDWNALQDHKNRIYISYDSTNKNSQAGDVDIVEFGKPKDDKGLPVFNVSLAYDKTNKIPLFYEEYPGSINDVSQLKYMVDKAYEYNYRSIGFILDRGYFSRANIEYMDEKEYSFLIMVKGCKPLVHSIVDKLHGSFEINRDCLIPHYRVYGKTIQNQLFQEDTKNRYFHLYFSPSRMAAEREQIEIKVEKLSAALKSMEGLEVKVEAPYTTYFDCFYDKKGRLLFAKEKKEVIQKELERCGYFCIVSSDKMDAADAYRLYKGRDVSEKLFREDKSFLGSKSMRVHSRRAVSAKLLLEFLALIVRNRIYNSLKDEMLRIGRRKNFMTVPAALKELEKIEMLRINSGRYNLDHAVTKTQQIILGAFGISKKDVEDYARAISTTLEKAANCPAEPDLGGKDDFEEDFYAPEID